MFKSSVCVECHIRQLNLLLQNLKFKCILDNFFFIIILSVYPSSNCLLLFFLFYSWIFLNYNFYFVVKMEQATAEISSENPLLLMLNADCLNLLHNYTIWQRFAYKTTKEVAKHFLCIVLH